MRQIYALMGAVLGVSVSVFGLTAQDVSVGGAYLGLGNYLNQDDANRAQFDFAANLDFEFQLTDDITGIVQLQTGAGSGSIGFVGPAAEVTDLNLVYEHPQLGWSATFGSFDTPFGEETGRLTNNADSFNNRFLSNSLLYSAFAGPVGTLNTLGVMVSGPVSVVDVTAAVSNGTDESASNPDNKFEGVVSVGTDVAGVARVVGSYMTSDDPNSGFETDFSGWLAEVRTLDLGPISVGGYYGTLTYGDGDAATEDDVAVWMAEGTWALPAGFLSVRYSAWNPDDSNADGAGISADIPNPGFGIGTASITPVADVDITRLQVGAGTYLTDDLMAKAEVFVDNYDDIGGGSMDVTGAVVYINGRF